tara:strand:+ start:1051 stop:1422 length:372 start_codon:yes stop_codon:yes gene_type:complete
MMIASLLGCAKHPGVFGTLDSDLRGGYGQFAGPEFESSNSPCIDGILANLDMVCKNISVQIAEPHMVVIGCDTPAKVTDWSGHYYMAYLNNSLTPEAAAATSYMFCHDGTAAVIAMPKAMERE